MQTQRHPSQPQASMDQIPVYRKRLLVASSLTPVSPTVDTVILGLYWGYMGIMEKKMETTIV